MESHYGVDSSTDSIVETQPVTRSDAMNNLEQLLQKQQDERMAQEADYCKLCPGGLTLLDKETKDGVSCADIDFYYQYLWPEPSNITMNVVGTCRADLGYNINSDFCCKASIPKYECEQNVHELLLGDNSLVPYNTAVAPIVSIDEPLIVSVSITYQALEAIDVELGTATVFMDVSMTWNDPRLKWNMADWDTCTNTINVFAGHDIETGTIWLPDFDLLNQVDGVQSAPSTKASVYSDGTVNWSISGGLQAFCAFGGLGKIPFDQLGCQLMFGPKTRMQSEQVRYVLTLPDFVMVGAFELTYNEWTIDPLATEQGTAFGGNVIYYNLYFNRATKHYIQNIVVPTILLTYLSFATYMLDMRVGERLGFGMALALVVVAQQIVTSELSPVSNQLLWLDKFVGWSFYWVLIGVIQSVLISFLYVLQEERSEKEEKRERRSMLVHLEDRMNEEEAAEEQMALANHQEGALSKTKKPKKSTRKCCSIYNIRLRRVDMISLIVAIATYSAYIVVMLSTVPTGIWLANEPRRFDESDVSYPIAYYNANDPNS
eukprot:CAMPEP_0116120890 /NCGR_PEP_ID=MMETSP0329-20121206/3411_1 /TAXON_ID=697910 /ORGANISM="Pseudo-nitzschia arenysensis, Strain B593" /LENGTH=544 /DNA_ID=CAMNT_0003614679 /DNA_START=177 /DNA_END=1811 /DNA_ORIENTATION=+